MLTAEGAELHPRDPFPEPARSLTRFALGNSPARALTFLVGAGWTRRRVGGTVARPSSEEGALSPAVSEQRRTMSDVGKTNIVVMWTVGPDDVAEGDRIFESHVEWMTGHPREGATALLSYKISKGPERSNPVDPNSELTGNTIFVLSEVYETPAGVAEHWRQAIETWQDLPAFMDWSGRVKVGTLHSGEVVQGLW
jgi:hypothetical protein